MKLYIIPLYYRQSIRNYGIDSADYKEEIKSSKTKMQKTAAHIYVSKIVTMTTHFLEKDPDIKKGKDLCCNFFFLPFAIYCWNNFLFACCSSP